jgi:steroid delta-isomerase-like uncharacterized protein
MTTNTATLGGSGKGRPKPIQFLVERQQVSPQRIRWEGKMKKLLCVIPLAVLISFAFGCQNKTEQAEVEKFRTQAKVEEQNKALATHMIEAWNKGDFDATKEMLAPGFVWYIPSNKIDIRSQEEAIEDGKSLHIGFPDANFSIEELYAVGDRVAYRYIMRATHQGEYAGIRATGNKVEMSGIAICRIENGKVVEIREEPDVLGFMQQLGMELKPKEAEK